MLVKNKKTQIKDSINEFAMNVGFLAMGGAMVLGLVEVAGAHPPKAVVPVASEATPVATAGDHNASKESIRRAEEVGPHHVTYGTTRTPSRSGAF